MVPRARIDQKLGGGLPVEDDEDDFTLADLGIAIRCPKCGNEMVSDGNSLSLAYSRSGGHDGVRPVGDHSVAFHAQSVRLGASRANHRLGGTV